MAWLRSLRDRIGRYWWARILAEHDTEPTELSGGVLKITIAVWLLLPWQALTPVFGAVTLVPEFWWSLFLMVVGVGHLMALRNGHVAWRRWGSLVGFCVWCSLGIVLWWNDAVGLTPILFLGAGVSQGWCVIRLGWIEQR